MLTRPSRNPAAVPGELSARANCRLVLWHCDSGKQGLDPARAYLVTIAVVALELGETLSDPVRRAIPRSGETPTC